MFNENWFLFILLAMMAFNSDGSINFTETNVIMAILFALIFSGVTTTELTEEELEERRGTTASDSNCFWRGCNG